ncbi:hypothetical protein [Nannocystis pusilla]|uniref:Uncharacterized protein n=1 Tax=Nannocystis pusilla TaxID=889268 RepID=A0ABS7TNF1_9BACT|nr:hypothetical protein [Nannocystis pusilla]MBZ5709754.1 hypothetical protein [Nannocystis pusilla]
MTRIDWRATGHADLDAPLEEVRLPVPNPSAAKAGGFDALARELGAMGLL